jgi:hypothetical protein
MPGSVLLTCQAAFAPRPSCLIAFWDMCTNTNQRPECEQTAALAMKTIMRAKAPPY